MTITFYLIVVSVLIFLTDLGSNHPTNREEHDSDPLKVLSRVKRLAGGRDAFPGDFPYIVQIRRKDFLVGSGAITRGATGNQIVVTTGTVLTSFVNTQLLNKEELEVRAGSTVFDSYFEDYEQKRRVRHMVRHQNWTRRGQFDIGIIFLDHDFKETFYVKEVDLPPFQYFTPNTTFLIAGWGQQDVDSPMDHSDKLQIIQMDPYPLDKCKKDYEGNPDQKVYDFESFCVRDEEPDGRRGFCLDDYGSPAVTIYPDSQLLYLAGFYSYAKLECNRTKEAAVFVNLAGLSGWIYSHSYPLLETSSAPYFVQITYRDQHLCSGALAIAPDGNEIVLTTAECISNDKGDPKPDEIRPMHMLKVRVGVDNTMDSKGARTPRIQFRDVVKIVRHPSWKRDAQNDLAILFPETPFERSRFCEPIALPPDNYTYPETDQNITVTALGTDQTPNSFSSLLQQIVVRAVSLQDCITAYDPKYGNKFVSAETSLCTRDPDREGSYGPCFDNIGAPAGAMNHRTGDFYLVGLFSWRDPVCGISQLPPIFTSINAHRKFITQNSEPPIQSDNSTDAR